MILGRFGDRRLERSCSSARRGPTSAKSAYCDGHPISIRNRIYEYVYLVGLPTKERLLKFVHYWARLKRTKQPDADVLSETEHIIMELADQLKDNK